MRLLLFFLLFQSSCFGQHPDDSLRLNTERIDSILNSQTIVFISYPEAEFPGGFQALRGFINNNLSYPQKAIEQEVSGRVYVAFVVEVDGLITNIEIVKSLHPSLDAEAIRLIKKMPNWIPAEGPDGPCKSRVRLPIIFSLTEN